MHRRPSSFLTCHIALVRIETQWCDGRKGFGTGSLIEQDVVVTAAHNVYRHAEYPPSGGVISKAIANRIIVQRGWSTSNTRGNVVSTHSTHYGSVAAVNPNYVIEKTGTVEYDFAIIKLTSPVKGVQPLRYKNYPTLSADQQLCTHGYPNDKPHPDDSKLGVGYATRGSYPLDRQADETRPFESFGQGDRLDGEVLYHSMATNSGWLFSPHIYHA